MFVTYEEADYIRKICDYLKSLIVKTEKSDLDDQKLLAELSKLFLSFRDTGNYQDLFKFYTTLLTQQNNFLEQNNSFFKSFLKTPSALNKELTNLAQVGTLLSLTKTYIDGCYRDEFAAYRMSLQQNKSLSELINKHYGSSEIKARQNNHSSYWQTNVSNSNNNVNDANVAETKTVDTSHQSATIPPENHEAMVKAVQNLEAAIAQLNSVANQVKKLENK